jgi:adenylate kinase family enzyme
MNLFPIVHMIGLPGAGKTTLANNMFMSYRAKRTNSFVHDL